MADKRSEAVQREEVLTSFLRNAGLKVETERRDPDARERERQAALRQRAENEEAWREFINAPRVEDGDASTPLVGAELKQLREALGLSVGDVSRITNVDPTTVEKAEEGAPTFANRTLVQVLHAFRDAVATQRTGSE